MAGDRQHSDGLALAEQALALRGTDPAKAAELARRAVIVSNPQSAGRGLARRVLALLALDGGDVDGARRHIVAAVRIAGQLAPGTVREGIYVSASGIMMFAGRLRQSLDFIERAVAETRGTPTFDLQFQRAWVLGRAGDPQEAMRSANQLSHRSDLSDRDRADAAALEATLALEQGRYRAALSAVQRTLDFYASGPPSLDSNSAFRNAALIFAAVGQLPDALAMLDHAERGAKELGHRVQTWTTIARAWTCLWGNLHEEAYTASELAWSYAARADLDTRAESGQILMRSAFAAGRTDRAVEIAALTRAMKIKLGQTNGARICQLMLLRRRAATSSGLRQLSTTAHLVGAGSQPNQLVAAHFDAFSAALEFGRLDIAGSHRSVLLANRSKLPALEQATVWLAESMWQSRGGDSSRARRSVTAGLQVLRRHRASLGSTELRTAASASGEALAAIGLRLALARGGGRDVLAASEAWRAQASLRRSAQPAAASEALDELRGIVARSQLSDGDRAEQRILLKRQIELEDRVRALTRHVVDSMETDTSPVLSDILRALGDRTLLSYVVVDGVVAAVVAQNGRFRLTRLEAKASAVENEQQKLAFSLRRLSHPGAPAAVRNAARRSAEQSLSMLSEQLIRPIGGLGDVDDVVIVAPAALHAIPWAALSTVPGSGLQTVVSVVPSATMLLRVDRGDSSVHAGAAGHVFCSGPRLAAADGEIADAAGWYDDATTIGADSTTDVLAALDGAAIAHFACHGHLRSDNPMFSALELHSGPLTVYDLERLTSTPDTMVLAACDSGVGAVRPGDELLGFTSALFAGGTRSVIASVIPVPDIATAALMNHVHRRIAAGTAPARALTAARREVHEMSHQGFVASIAFGAFGVR